MSRTFLLVLFLTGSFLPLNAQQSSYTISYLGRTFGYFRVPGEQPSSGGHCDASAVDLPPVREMLHQIAASGPHDALLALGDDFAPQLEARTIQKDGRLQPKDQLVFDYLDTHSWIGYDSELPELQRSEAEGRSVIDFDNVGCFFKLAGFDAIVPGKQEFHYGPQRLQELARYLADEKSGKDVEMLAANLTISTVLVNPPAQTRTAPKPENYAYAGPNGAQFSLPSIPMPYLREFPIQNGISVEGYVTSSAGEAHLQKLSQAGLSEGTNKTAKPLYTHAWICQRELGPRLDPAGCTELAAAESQGTTLKFKLQTGKFGLYPDPTAIQPGIDYHICASVTDQAAGMNEKNTICHPTFQFHYPFFQWGHASQPNPKLYVPRHGSVVIFGVLDPDLINQIDALNETWLNVNPLFKTQLEIVDPHDALSQLMQTCQVDPACAGKRHVLLAQMPPQRAQRLAAHLDSRDGFDLIVSQADEAEATGDLTRTDHSDAANGLRPLVVTPQTTVVTGKPDRLRLPLASATVSSHTSGRSLSNVLRSEEVDLTPEQYTGKRQLWELMVQSGLVPAPPEKSIVDGRTIVETGILSVMRAYCKSDVAMLQDRDLYRPEHYAVERPAAAELQSLLDRLLWKGDFISCRPVPGSLLKQVTALSNQFAAGANNELALDVQSGTAVKMLGMFSNPGSGLVTDGALVEDARQYSVALTDFLANGETGYTVLAGGVNPKKIEASDFNEITALVCRRLIGQLSDSGGNGTFCRAPLQAAAYLDPILMQPYALPQGAGTEAKLREWAIENWSTQKILAPVKGDAAEYKAQNRRVLSVRLDRADLGYQRNLHSLNEAEQQQRFAGVQAAQPTASERYDWTADFLLRVTSSGRNVDRFVQADAEYENSGVKQLFTTATGSTETYQLSLPQNATGLEVGLETRLYPRRQKNITGVRLLTSFRYQTEVSRPFIQFQAADGFLNETVPRGNALIAKAGLRYDGQRSWLELGMQTGPQTQVQSFTLGSLSCQPENVSLCLSATGNLPFVQQVQGLPFQVSTTRRDQSGVFLNGRIHLPLLYKHLDYVIENQGTLFFNRAGDSSTDTHYLELMTHSLVIPVIGDLAIVPKVDIFLFQNKVAGWHIHGYQTSVTAQYRFDWHTGLRWKDVLRYPSPPPAQ